MAEIAGRVDRIVKILVAVPGGLNDMDAISDSRQDRVVDGRLPLDGYISELGSVASVVWADGLSFDEDHVASF